MNNFLELFQEDAGGSSARTLPRELGLPKTAVRGAGPALRTDIVPWRAES
jgi:hypothetical protein